MICQALVDYVAEKTVEDIRSGRYPAAELAKAILGPPFVDAIRSRLSPEDWPVLQVLCDSHDADVAWFGVSLLRGMMHIAEVRRYVEQTFWRAGLPFVVRVSLQAQLLDAPDLEPDTHTALFRFTIQNWTEWIACQKEWASRQGDVLAWFQSRLASPQFPRSKRWFYICALAASDNEPEVERTLRAYADDADEMVREAVRETLARVASGPATPNVTA